MEVKSLAQISLQGTDLVLLDLDNTLYNYHETHHAALESIIKPLQAEYSISADEIKILYNKSRKNVHNRLHGTAAAHSRLFYIQELVESLSGTTKTKLISSLYELYWNTFIEKMQLFPDVMPFLKALQNEKANIILVTDMTAEVQFKKVQKLGLEKYLSFIVTSEEAGVEKPHPYIFELAIMKALRLRKKINKIAVIGDDLKKDFYELENFCPVEVFNVIR